MLWDTLKQEIDKLSESQLKQIADFVMALKVQQLPPNPSFWQTATAIEREQDFRAWVAQLPKTRVSLIDKAFDRANIYE